MPLIHANNGGCGDADDDNDDDDDDEKDKNDDDDGNISFRIIASYRLFPLFS